MSRYIELDQTIQDLERQLEQARSERERLRSQLMDWLGSDARPSQPAQASGQPQANGRSKRGPRRAHKSEIKAAIPHCVTREGQSRREILDALERSGYRISPANLSILLRELREEGALRVVGQRSAAKYYPS